MKDKIRLILAGILIAAVIMGVKYWFARPYVMQSGAYMLIAALTLLFYYPAYRLTDKDGNAEAIRRFTVTLIIAALLAWVTSWVIRWAAVQYFSAGTPIEAAIVGLETCAGKFCACENKWTLQMPDGKRHTLCTERLVITEKTRIEHGKPVSVTLRQSPFDHSIE